MKLKSFDDYLKERLDADEIAEIEWQAQLEHEALKALQENVADIVSKFMEEKKIGFSKMVRKLGYSPGKLFKIQKREANLTFASLAHLGALMNKMPTIIFKDPPKESSLGKRKVKSKRKR